MQSAHDPFAENLAESPEPSLYPVEMEGDPTAPESLLSWIVALAQAHCLGPRTLVKYLMSRSAQHGNVWNDAAFFERHCGTVTGLGIYARMMVDLFGQSQPAAIGQMTLLSLAHLLPRNGEGLLASNPRWCHVCLCEQVRRGRRAHFRLLWSFEYYRVCHEHHVVMSERCPACGNRQGFLPIYPSLMHCNSCGESMIAPLPSDFTIEAREVPDFYKWCSAGLADLVSRLGELQQHGSLEYLRRNIESMVEKFAKGNRVQFCKLIGLQSRALNGWLSKDERPSLSVLLRLCFSLQIEPAAMYLPDAVEHAQPPSLVETFLGTRQSRPLLGYRERERIQKLLEVIIADPADTRRLVMVANQVGLSRSALKYWFKDQCKQIVLRNRSHEIRRLELRYRNDHQLLLTIVQGLRAQDTYPSRRRVDSELRRHHISLMRPDIFWAFKKMTAI